MRFNVSKHRAVAEILRNNPKPATADAVEMLADTILDSCDEIEFHKKRRTFHDTLTLMKHDHTAKCLEAYKKAFLDLIEYVNECADFRNGVTDPSSGVDEGAVKALRFISGLQESVFLAETRHNHETAAPSPTNRVCDHTCCHGSKTCNIGF